MKVKAVDFVCYAVNDIEASKDFYQNTLGLPLTQDGDDFVEFDAGNVTICIGRAEAMGEKIENPQGNAQVGFAVEDVEKTVAELKEKGVEIVMDTDDFGICKMAIIKDPTGNKICLHHRKDGTVG